LEIEVKVEVESKSGCFLPVAHFSNRYFNFYFSLSIAASTSDIDNRYSWLKALLLLCFKSSHAFPLTLQPLDRGGFLNTQ
jgi:hypothetical protein